ncbi:O-antigen ligase family protein [Sulfurospirillum deleyianum]|uniref:O-antigen polymerase n=1 Tax=Sulfurospirillum deleyianum (strain ATCC 51133 / DSM 6946 / 5175) TaxID=525898 RepID=D1B406_SULD5|nr:O-antigen ligase family protein [Sulfurospirillum deleyianum]ACZ12826.1 O-antigen polymerase [Sulfurospirillum deleyianum DSM 6946]
MNIAVPLFSYHFETKLEKVTFYSLLLFVLLLPFSKAFMSFCVFYFPLLLFLNFGIKGIWERLKCIPAMLPFFLFIGYMSVTVLWTERFVQANGLLKLYFLLSLIPSLALLVKKEWLKPLVVAFLFSLSVSSALSMGHYLEWWQIRGQAQLNTSPFMNSIHYSVFMAVGAISTLYIMITLKRDRVKQFGLLALSLLLIVTLFLSNGRTGQLSFLVALCWMIVMFFRGNMKLLSGLVFTVFIAAYGIYNGVPQFQKRIDTIFVDVQKMKQGVWNTSIGLRLSYWLLAKEIVLEHPLLGVGYGDYKLAVEEALQKNDFGIEAKAKAFLITNDLHSQYLMVVVQGGLIGLVLFVWFLIALYRLPIQNPVYKRLSLLLLSIYIIGCFPEPLLILLNPLTLFAFFVGLSMAVSSKLDQEKVLH